MYMYISHVKKYPTMHHFGIPEHTQPLIANETLTWYYPKLMNTLHCGNAAIIPC